MKKTLFISSLIYCFVVNFANASEAELQQKINEQNEKIDGLTSVVEGLNDKIQALEEIIKNKDAQSEEDTRNEKLIKDLAKMIDDLDNKCVKKDELKAMLESQKYSSEETQAGTNIPSDENKMLENAKALFRNKDYQKSKEYFLELDKKNYKTAIADYYLGEIAYYDKNYKDALYYYKKSAKLDSNSSYIDTLLLHSGISLESTKDNIGAKKFYELIIEKYPERTTAKIAKQHLDNFSSK
jgi:TolA-binding protein